MKVGAPVSERAECLFDKHTLQDSDNQSSALGWLPGARRVTPLATRAVHECWGYLYLFCKLFQIIYLRPFICSSPSNKEFGIPSPCQKKKDEKS